MDEEWQLVTSFLPAHWKALARESGALRRARNVPNADTLLRLIFLHTATSLSLRQAVARAKAVGLAEISDVALLKRLKGSAAWLQTLTQQLTGQRFEPADPAGRLAGRQIRVVDATDIQEPGATGTDWRVHYSLRVPGLECDFFELTDEHGGETYKRIPVQRSDVLLADAGYCHRQGVAQVITAAADVVVRYNPHGFPLLDAPGQPLEVLPLLRALAGHQAGEWPVQFDSDGHRYTVRLCAIRKSQTATLRAQKKLRRRAQTSGKALQPETLELAGYVMVLTSLPSSVCSAAQVLELYRVRWQVELLFKRLKSLLALGHVPKYDPQSCRAWLQAKLLGALLIECLMREAKFFSPWGVPTGRGQPLEAIY